MKPTSLLTLITATLTAGMPAPEPSQAKKPKPSPSPGYGNYKGYGKYKSYQNYPPTYASYNYKRGGPMQMTCIKGEVACGESYRGYCCPKGATCTAGRGDMSVFCSYSEDPLKAKPE